MRGGNRVLVPGTKKQRNKKSDNWILKRCIFTVMRDIHYTARGKRPLNHVNGGQHNGPRIQRL